MWAKEKNLKKKNKKMMYIRYVFDNKNITKI